MKVMSGNKKVGTPWSNLKLPRFELHMLLNAETWAGQFHLDFSNNYELYPLVGGQPATRPAINSLRITCDLIPQWPINLSGNPNHVWIDQRVNGVTNPPVTLLDIFASIHRVLQTPILHSDWGNVAKNERYAISKAYQKRYKAAENPEEERLKGVKRIDFLKGKVYFNGLLMDWENGVMKLVMGSQANSSLSQGLSNPPSMAETQSREKVLKKISDWLTETQATHATA
ncbi:hypothetical protein D9758_018174 [Tetrapyrgos nigripes]|uniref:DUF6699 domain-containing protein n=1 Tax=Tetrapyrgos nigripes TaxID=182062 RepID=A0A8H5B074_9AGAR|nr:hypothetical protein D9758_018174 [Tetrapyrgos nigripes]